MVFSRSGLFSRRRPTRPPEKETGEEKRSRRIGYVPLGGADTLIAGARDRLTVDGCEAIIENDDAALATLGAGDLLVVGDLGQFGRSLPELVVLLDELTRRGVCLRSLDDGIDTSSPNAAPALALLAALAAAGRSRPPTVPAPLRPVRPGRKPKLSAQQVRVATALLHAGESRKSVARTLGVSAPTLRHALRRHGPEEQK